MTPRQRNTVVGLSVVLVLLAVLLSGMILAGGNTSHVRIAASAVPGTEAPQESTTVTTVDLVPVASSMVPLPAPTTSSPATTIPAPPTTMPPPPLVTGAGAILTPPPARDERHLAPGAGCDTLADPGWDHVLCGVAHASGAELIWLTEQRMGAAATASRALVFRSAGAPGAEDVVLEAADDQGDRFSGIKVRVDSVAGDGTDDIAFGFREQGSGAVLAVDLVHGPGVVAVHQSLAKGVARSATGQLDTWSAVLAPGDANCCPSSYEHDTIRDVSGEWRIVARVAVPPDQVPPSQL